MSLRQQIQMMVVDDMSTSRGLIIKALDEIGVLNYTWEASGDAAFNSLMTKPVHLILSDYNMPGMSGIDLLRKVREYGPLSRTGFIMITGSPDQRILQAGQVLGLNNFIKKPFSTAQLKACIETVVGRL